MNYVFLEDNVWILGPKNRQSDAIIDLLYFCDQRVGFAFCYGERVKEENKNVATESTLDLLIVNTDKKIFWVNCAPNIKLGNDVMIYVDKQYYFGFLRRSTIGQVISILAKEGVIEYAGWQSIIDDKHVINIGELVSLNNKWYVCCQTSNLLEIPEELISLAKEEVLQPKG